MCRIFGADLCKKTWINNCNYKSLGALATSVEVSVRGSDGIVAEIACLYLGWEEGRSRGTCYPRT